MVSDLLRFPLIVGIIVSVIGLWKSDKFDIVCKSIGAALFWGAAYCALYSPASLGVSPLARQTTQLAPRLAAFVLFLEGCEPFTGIVLSSMVANATLSFTKARAKLAKRIVRLFDLLSILGVILLLYAFASGAVPSE